MKLTLDKAKIPTSEKEQERYKVGVAYATEQSDLKFDEYGMSRAKKLEYNITSDDYKKANLIFEWKRMVEDDTIDADEAAN